MENREPGIDAAKNLSPSSIVSYSIMNLNQESEEEEEEEEEKKKMKDAEDDGDDEKPGPRKETAPDNPPLPPKDL